QVLKGFRIALWVWGIVGLLLAVGMGFTQERKWPAAALFGGIYCSAWGLTWVWMVYNSLVDTRNRVRQGWSQLDVQLKRRHDLIPRLVACVDALRSHEKDVQTAVTAMRTQESATLPGESGPEIHGIARTIIALGESYPVLKTDGAFLNLQKEIIETEQRIALARAYFNDIATAYNTRLEVFPDSLIGMITGFKQRPLLTAQDFERAEVHVKLAD
ncbi:MAG TPA: LemA family protein, partial [Verrucomicrobiales bacterium]|nr:LemA family protein [Verrucomicrobiales bacterium]